MTSGEVRLRPAWVGSPRSCGLYFFRGLADSLSLAKRNAAPVVASAVEAVKATTKRRTWSAPARQLAIGHGATGGPAAARRSRCR